MEIIIKYDFGGVDATLFNPKDVYEHIKGCFERNLCIFDNDGDRNFSDEEEPEIIISQATTLFATTLKGKTICNFNTEHVPLLRANLFMFDESYSKVKQPAIFKDKNDNFFAENSVLQFIEHANCTLKTGKMLICWDEQNACYGFKWEHCPYKKVIFPFAAYENLKENIFNHCELIGNIFKNPELMTIFQ